MSAARMAATVLMLLASGARAEEPLRVFAAASLTEAFRDIAAAFEKAHGMPVELNLAGSQILRTQIEQGAPADVFASADLLQADALRQEGLMPGHEVFARNALVLVVPARGARVRLFEDIARPGLKIVVAGPSVPAGLYTLQVLARVGGSGRFGDHFRSHVQANIASHETSVRLVLAKVALGEADAGFVYETDAAASDNVLAIPIPEGNNVAVEYPIGVVAEGPRAAHARAFVDFVLGESGQAILRKHGFR